MSTSTRVNRTTSCPPAFTYHLSFLNDMEPLLAARPKVPFTPPSSPDDEAFDATPSSSTSSKDGNFAESIVRMALGDDHTEPTPPISARLSRMESPYLSTKPRFSDLDADVIETIRNHVIKEANQIVRSEDKNLDGIFNTWVFEMQLYLNSHRTHAYEATGFMTITPFFNRVRLLKMTVIVDPKVFVQMEIVEGIARELLRFPDVRALEINIEVPDVQRVTEDGTAVGVAG